MLEPAYKKAFLQHHQNTGAITTQYCTLKKTEKVKLHLSLLRLPFHQLSAPFHPLYTPYSSQDQLIHCQHFLKDKSIRIYILIKTKSNPIKSLYYHLQQCSTYNLPLHIKKIYLWHIISSCSTLWPSVLDCCCISQSKQISSREKIRVTSIIAVSLLKRS